MEHIFLLTTFIIFSSLGSCLYALKDAKTGTSSEFFSSNCNETFAKPANMSISYLLFTKENKLSPCYLQPNNPECKQCELDPFKETKILIHGYKEEFYSGNIFERIKDSLLLENPYNVIIVNWTHYNQVKYKKAVKNAYLVGIEVGKFINFLSNETGVNPTDIHLIGFSLGAHIAGVAGKQVPNLGRISGLDPASPLYSLNVTHNRLTDSDANFVDVIHCSKGTSDLGSKGYGIFRSIGQINFYPNGGIYQPTCKIGSNYTLPDGTLQKIKSKVEAIRCGHTICPIYFYYSIHDCKFLSRECGSYEGYETGGCFTESHPANMMGLFAEKIPGLPNHSKFYLNTTADPPYC